MALEPTEPSLTRTTATLRTETERNAAALRRVAQLEPLPLTPTLTLTLTLTLSLTLSLTLT